MILRSIDSSRYDITSLLYSFVAGAFSASVAFYLVGGKLNKEELIKKWMKEHIGELSGLASVRRKWPWDRKKSLSRSASPAAARAPSKPTIPPKKSDYCIGSIFGLDVGGTLAKLVYFEQKPEHSDSEFVPFREKLYQKSAMAQAVLLARRGTEVRDDMSLPSMRQQQQRKATFKRPFRKPSLPHSQASEHPLPHSQASEQDLKDLLKMRQESVPDNLDVYAEQHSNPRTPVNNNTTQNDVGNNMRRSKSMFNMHAEIEERKEALDHFYNFLRRLDSYQQGVKDSHLQFYSRQLGGEFHFIRFETRHMQNAMDLIRANKLHMNIREMGATGGGAHKFAGRWQEELGIDMKKEDELDSLVAGMQFVLSTVVGECYTFRPKQHKPEPVGVGAPIIDDDSCSSSTDEQDRGKGDEWWWSRKVQRDAISESATYPYLLVSIGTGVSILRVDGPRQQDRISGSTIGGGTYYGLIRLLTELESFEDIMELAERGDPSKVDMMVGDIYGGNNDALEKFGLSSNLVASSFGKLVAKEDPASGLKEEDLARALLLMVTNNIGQVAYLNAKLHNTPRIYFVGNFLRQNLISQRRLSFAIDFWSKGEMEALFLEHEGYFGALGAFLLSQGIPHHSTDRIFQPQTTMPLETKHASAPKMSGLDTAPPQKLHKRSQTTSSLNTSSDFQ
jgi:type II pantothenate kinase